MQKSEVPSKNLPAQTKSATSNSNTTPPANTNRARRQGRRLGKENRGSSSRKKNPEKTNTETSVNVALSSGNSSSGNSFARSSPSDSGRSSLGASNNPRENSPKPQNMDSPTGIVKNNKEDSADLTTEKVSDKYQSNSVNTKPNNSYDLSCMESLSFEEAKSDAKTSQEQSNDIVDDRIVDNSCLPAQSKQEERDDSVPEKRKLTTPDGTNKGWTKSLDHTEKSSVSSGSDGNSRRPKEEVSYSYTTRGLTATTTTTSSPTRLFSQQTPHQKYKNSLNSAFETNANLNRGNNSLGSQILYFYNQMTGQIMMLPVASEQNGVESMDELSQANGPQAQLPFQNFQFQVYPNLAQGSAQFAPSSQQQAQSQQTGALSTTPVNGTEDFAQFLPPSASTSALDAQSFQGLLPLFLQSGEQAGLDTSLALNWPQGQSNLLLYPPTSNGNFLYSNSSVGSNQSAGFVNFPGSAPLFLESNQTLGSGPANGTNMRNPFLIGNLHYNKNSVQFSNGSSHTNGTFQANNSANGRGLFFPQFPVAPDASSGQLRLNKKSPRNSNNSANHNNNTNSNSNSLQHQNGGGSGGNSTSPNHQNGGGLVSRQISNQGSKGLGNDGKVESKGAYGNQKLMLNYEALPFLSADILKPKRHSSQTNLYLRGLSKDFTEEQLHALAPDKSLIRSVKLIVEDESECYGFIDFNSNESAKQALNHIKESNPDVYVNFAYESEKDPLNIYITNIPEIWTASNVEDLKKIFQPYGQISTAIVMTKRSNNFCTGAGFVRFCQSEDAQKAIEGIRKAQIILEGAKRPLEVKLADRQKTPEEQALLSQLKHTSNPSMKNVYRNFDLYPKHHHGSSYPDNPNHTPSNPSQYRSHKNNNSASNGAQQDMTESYRTNGPNKNHSGLRNGNNGIGHHSDGHHHPHSYHNGANGQMSGSDSAGNGTGLPFNHQNGFASFPSSQGYNPNKVNFAVAMLQNSAALSAAVAAANGTQSHQYVPDNLYFSNSQWTGNPNNFSSIPAGSTFSIQ